MKTVTGKLVSTKPISQSNAAKYIYRFTSSNNGASPVVNIYLQRTSDSFNSLVQFQKKLKGSHSRWEEQVSQLLDLDAKVKALSTVDENPQREKIKNSESRGKGKKKQEFKLNNDVQLEIKQDNVVVNEDKMRNSSEVLAEGGEKSKPESAEVEGGSEKRKKKKKRKTNEDAEVEERSKGEDGKKAVDRKFDAGETNDLSEHSGTKNVRKSEGFDKTKQDIMDDEGDMNGVKGASVERRDKKKKKKENECEQEEEGIGGVGVQKQNKYLAQGFEVSCNHPGKPSSKAVNVLVVTQRSQKQAGITRRSK